MADLGTLQWLQQGADESDADYAARLQAWDAADKRTPQQQAAAQALIDSQKRSLVESNSLDPANGDANTAALQAINTEQTGYASGSAPDSVIPGVPDFKLPDLSGVAAKFNLGNISTPLLLLGGFAAMYVLSTLLKRK